jgi:hypothetical protein
MKSTESTCDDDELLGRKAAPKKPTQCIAWPIICIAIPIIAIWAALLCLTMPRYTPWPTPKPGSCTNQTIRLGNYSGKATYATSLVLKDAGIEVSGYIDSKCKGDCFGVLHASVSSKYGTESLTGRDGRGVRLDGHTCRLKFMPDLDLPGGVEHFDGEYQPSTRCFFWEARTLVGAISGPLCPLGEQNKN